MEHWQSQEKKRLKFCHISFVFTQETGDIRKLNETIEIETDNNINRNIEKPWVFVPTSYNEISCWCNTPSSIEKN